MGRWKEEQEKNKLQNTKTQEQDQLERSIPCRPFIFHSPLNQQSGNQQKGKTTQVQVQSRAQHDTLQRNTVYDHAPLNNVRPKNADPLTANYSTRALHYAALQAHHGLPRKPGKHNRCPSQYPSQYPSTRCPQAKARTDTLTYALSSPPRVPPPVVTERHAQHSDRRPNK